MILVCEDEEKVRSYLVDSLTACGQVVNAVSNLDELNTFLKVYSSQIDVLILDRLLENQDSLKFIPNLKKIKSQMRILVLSALHSAEEKAEALDLGADDYVEKPFRLVELQARLRVLQRSQAALASNQGESSFLLKIGDLYIDRIKHQVKTAERVVELSNKEYSLLLTLASHPGRIYNRYQLLDSVWSMQFDVESNVVEVTIKNLRKKLATSGSQLVIESRRHVGYWIEE